MTGSSMAMTFNYAKPSETHDSVASGAGSRGWYLGIAIVCCAMAMAGFIPVYYWPVLQGATAFPLRLHLHAAVATLWLLLLIAQTGLVWGGRRHLHMRLGI